MFNVVRSQPAPISLKARSSYRGDDVIEALAIMFHNKCYLCERSEPTSMNVEHFDPHMGDVDKKFAWENLFFVCARCNNVKLSKYKNLLNCTDPTVDVFRAVKLLPPRTAYGRQVVVEAMFDDAKTKETAELLNVIYNSDHSGNKRLTGVFLRKAIHKKYARLLELLIEYESTESSAIIKSNALEKMKALMGAQQEYSAFLRWVVLEDIQYSALLADYIMDH